MREMGELGAPTLAERGEAQWGLGGNGEKNHSPLATRH